VLPFGRLWYTEIPHAIGYGIHYSRSADAAVRVYDAAGNVIETHNHRASSKSCKKLPRLCGSLSDACSELRVKREKAQRFHYPSFGNMRAEWVRRRLPSGFSIGARKVSVVLCAHIFPFVLQ
jgi:hypothetical protein